MLTSVVYGQAAKEALVPYKNIIGLICYTAVSIFVKLLFVLQFFYD